MSDSDQSPAAGPRIPPDRPLRAWRSLDAPGGMREEMLRVETARLVYADHVLLAADLPGLADPEAWLLANAALISREQAASEAANTPIRTGAGTVAAYRPQGYGRAVVVEADGGASGSLLLDLKGAGIQKGRAPQAAAHRTGLCSLREALREALFQALIDGLLARAAPDLWTVPIYAVIDLGFDLLNARGERLPAGLIVRRAHRRDMDDAHLPWRGTSGERLRLEIELLLRGHGITSANATSRYRLEAGGQGPAFGQRDEPLQPMGPELAAAGRAVLGEDKTAVCEGVNIQLARIEPAPGFRAQLVDFGHYEIRRRFDRALVSRVRDAQLLWGASILPGDPHFIQPDPALAEPLSAWARQGEAAGFGEAPRVLSDPCMRWADRAARGFRAETVSGEQIARFVSAFRGPWTGLPPA